MMKKHKKQARKGRAKREAMIAPFLFVAFVCWYAMCEDGTVCSNDGSSYALTKSIVERGSLSIGREDEIERIKSLTRKDTSSREELEKLKNLYLTPPYTDNTPENAERYWLLTEVNDYAKRDGNLYTDRSPGTAFLAVPLYLAGELVLNILPPEKAPFFHQPGTIRRSRYKAYWGEHLKAYGDGVEKRHEIERGEKKPNPRFRTNFHGKTKALFYSLGFQGLELPPEPTTSPAEETRQYFAALLPGLLTALAVVFIYLSCRVLGLKHLSGIAAALVYGLCTVHLKYGTVLFTHAATGFFVVLSLFITLRIGHARRKGMTNYFLLGFAWAMTFICEYPYVLFGFGFLIYLFIRDRKRRMSTKELMPRYSVLALGALIPLVAFGAYNAHCFGSPFSTSYQYQVGYDFNKELPTAFAEPIDEGLKSLLFDPDYKGLLVSTPIMLLAVAGFYFFFRRHRSEAALVAALFLLMLLIMSKKTETTAGASRDHRYLAASLGLLVVGAGFFLDGTLRARRAELRYLGLAVFAGLFIYSAVKQFSYYLTFMTNMEPAERLASLGLTFPGFSRLILIYPAAALAGFVWYVVQKRMSPPEVGDAPGGAKKSVAKTRRKTSRHRKKRK